MGGIVPVVGIRTRANMREPNLASEDRAFAGLKTSDLSQIAAKTGMRDAIGTFYFRKIVQKEDLRG